jgi:hypothetical protein
MLIIIEFEDKKSIYSTNKLFIENKLVDSK